MSGDTIGKITSGVGALDAQLQGIMVHLGSHMLDVEQEKGKEVAVTMPGTGPRKSSLGAVANISELIMVYPGALADRQTHLMHINSQEKVTPSPLPP